MNRLWVKLTLAFLAVALVAVAVVGVLVLRNTGTQFRQYVVHATMAGQPGLAQELAAYYETHGAWDGVDTLFAGLSHAPAAEATGRGRGRAGAALADAEGRVVYSAGGELAGRKLANSVLAQGVPIVLPDGTRAGTVLNLEPATATLDVQGQAFLDRVAGSLVWAGLLAVAAALTLGLAISRRLTAPLRRLTEATAAVAGGNLGQRVGPLGGDEIGELGDAFDRMAANLQQSENLRRSLMADVAHELRTPLTVVQGSLQAILDGVYPLDAAQIAGLYDETRLLTRLVEDLRELALAEAGQIRLERGPVDLAALARSAAGNFGPAADAAGVTLAVEAAADAPLVDGDADRLAQVLRNLLSNALHHTPAGGRITMRVSAAAAGVTLTVTDTGSGIAAADLPHVFDRFYSGDKSRRTGGAGLGLAIARQLVLAHGGAIEAHSPPGAGATFTVRLPVAG